MSVFAHAVEGAGGGAGFVGCAEDDVEGEDRDEAEIEFAAEMGCFFGAEGCMVGEVVCVGGANVVRLADCLGLGGGWVVVDEDGGFFAVVRDAFSGDFCVGHGGKTARRVARARRFRHSIATCNIFGSLNREISYRSPLDRCPVSVLPSCRYVA